MKYIIILILISTFCLGYVTDENVTNVFNGSFSSLDFDENNNNYFFVDLNDTSEYYNFSYGSFVYHNLNTYNRELVCQDTGFECLTISPIITDCDHTGLKCGSFVGDDFIDDFMGTDTYYSCTSCTSPLSYYLFKLNVSNSNQFNYNLTVNATIETCTTGGQCTSGFRVYCHNYTDSTWTQIIQKYESNPSQNYNSNYVVTIPNECQQDIIQILGTALNLRSANGQTSRIKFYEFDFDNISVNNVTFDFNNDSTIDYSVNVLNDNVTIPLNLSSIQDFVSSCTDDCDYYINSMFPFNSDSSVSSLILNATKYYSNFTFYDSITSQTIVPTCTLDGNDFSITTYETFEVLDDVELYCSLLSYQDLNNTIYLINVSDNYNMTPVSLSLTFSSATDVTVVTSDETYYFNGTTILQALTNLSLGKVSVIFNGGTQYYEFYNDQSTYINESLKVLSGSDTEVTVKAIDQAYSILDEAIIDIYELDDDTDTTSLISTLYGNSEKVITLTAGDSYLASSSLSGYTQENDFELITVSSTNNNIVTDLKISSDSEKVNTMISIDPFFYFDEGETSKNYTVSVSTEVKQQIIKIYHYIDGVLQNNGNPYSSGFSVTGFEKDLIYTKNEGNHTIKVFAGTNALNVVQQGNDIVIKEGAITVVKSANLENITTSKAAFLVFLIFVLLMGGAVQQKSKDYGVIVILILSTALSFINYYMLLLSLPLIIIKVLQKVMGHEE